MLRPEDDPLRYHVGMTLVYPRFQRLQLLLHTLENHSKFPGLFSLPLPLVVRNERRRIDLRAHCQSYVHGAERELFADTGALNRGPRDVHAGTIRGERGCASRELSLDAHSRRPSSRPSSSNRGINPCATITSKKPSKRSTIPTSS